MKKLIKLFILLFYVSVIWGQNSFNKIYRIDPQQQAECAFGGLVATDTAFYLTGIHVNEEYNKDAMFVRLDTSGNLQIAKTYGFSGQTTVMWYNDMQSSAEGNFLNTAKNTIPPNGSQPGINTVILTKFNPQGDTLFWKVIILMIQCKPL